MEMEHNNFKVSNDARAATGYYYEPNICPLCKRAIKPTFLYGFADIERETMYLMFQCRSCYGAFIKTCKTAATSATNSVVSIRELENSDAKIAPNPPETVSFSKYIMDISPKFSEIYNQANAAECYELDEIAGIGYRKSIEFLIKDFLSIGKTDEEIEAIKSKPLGKCISEDITNENLRITASRAVWIGNDETHYIRKHTDKDITDLKRLIKLTVRWIEMECMTKEAQGIPYIK